jgi:hypothetical protein
VDDPYVDGDPSYTVTLASASSDSTYNTYSETFTVTNTDDDVAAVLVDPASVTTNENGTTAAFSMRLGSQPSADVTVSFTSGDTSECGISPESLTFASANWSTAQTVTVTGVDDFIVDGDITYDITGSASAPGEPHYDGINVPVVTVTNQDDDVLNDVPFNLYVTGDFVNAPFVLNYHWTHQNGGDTSVPAASWYRVVVARDGTTYVDEWFSASGICTGVECAVTYVDKQIEVIEANGVYSWWVEAYVDDTTRLWSDEATFTIDVAAPSEIVRTAPVNNTTVSNAVLQWQAADGTGWYEVVAVGPNSYAYQQWHEGVTICQNGTCSLSIDATAAGQYEWYVRGWNDGGMGPWQSSAATFQLELNTPAVVALTSPSSTVSSGSVAFTWTADVNAGWYNIVVQSTTNMTAVLDRWVSAPDVCANGNCVYTVDSLMNDGYAWYVRGWSPAGYGPWQQSGMNFTLNAATPTVPTLNTPASGGSVNAGAVTLTWAHQSTAAYYHIYLSDPTGNNMILDQWYSAADHCTGTTCSLNVTLPAGSYGVWMRAWGPGGITDWNSGSTWTVK